MYYYKKNIGDYYKKTGRLSMMEHGAYTLLIDSCYDRERFPTLDEALDWTWARTDQEIEAVKFVLSKFFELKDGIYTQSRICDELMNYHALSETNSRIAKEREEKRRNRKRIEHEACTERDESVNEAPPNQEPRTKNQEPLTSNKDIGAQDKPSRFMFAKELENQGGDKNIITEYMAHRKSKKASNSKIAFDGLIREQQKSGLSLDDVMRMCIERAWRGFESKWTENQQQLGFNGNYQTAAQKTEAEQEKWRLACEPERPNEINVTPVDNWSGFLNG